MELIQFDSRRILAKPGDKTRTLQFCVDDFLKIAQESIDDHGHFYVALSGGSTPKAIYQLLADPKNAKRIDWNKVSIFWSDERCVPPDNDDSNYKMAMENGIAQLKIPDNQIFRMKGELDPKKSADEYNALIKDHVPECRFDLIMLGMGEDGHTASLFPHTEGLHITGKEAIANFLPQKNIWRLSLTFECINRSSHPIIYVLGASKASMVEEVLSSPYSPDNLPIQKIGTPEHKALWILDKEASAQLFPESSI